MRIICEVCKQEGYLQQLGNYFRVRHYEGKAEYARANFLIASNLKNMQSSSLAV